MTRPRGFVPWPHPSPLLDAIGSLEIHESDPARIGFMVGGSNVNSRGLLHAGAITSIADVAIGHRLGALLRERGHSARYLTVELSCSFLGVARSGEWVEGRITPLKVGRRVAAGTAVFGLDEPIASATAVFVTAD